MDLTALVDPLRSPLPLLCSRASHAGPRWSFSLHPSPRCSCTYPYCICTYVYRYVHVDLGPGSGEAVDRVQGAQRARERHQLPPSGTAARLRRPGQVSSALHSSTTRIVLERSLAARKPLGWHRVLAWHGNPMAISCSIRLTDNYCTVFVHRSAARESISLTALSILCYCIMYSTVKSTRTVFCSDARRTVKFFDLHQMQYLTSSDGESNPVRCAPLRSPFLLLTIREIEALTVRVLDAALAFPHTRTSCSVSTPY